LIRLRAKALKYVVELAEKPVDGSVVKKIRFIENGTN
jgi:hypothetical protein